MVGTEKMYFTTTPPDFYYGFGTHHCVLYKEPKENISQSVEYRECYALPESLLYFDLVDIINLINDCSSLFDLKSQ